MVTKCANIWCFAPRHNQEGKLFRLDIDLGSETGGSERKRNSYGYALVALRRCTPRSRSQETL